jgi:GT2 family glycosyltransferase
MINNISKLNDLSIVIATLGQDNIRETICYLNSGLNKPSKILVCIPEPEFSTIIKYNDDNVEYLLSPSRGQVFQRTFAFNFINSNFVLQIDDDVLINQDSLIELVGFLKERPFASVSPSLLGNEDNKPSNFMINPNSNLFLRFLFFIANGKNGFVPGGISLSGINIGYDYSAVSPYKVDWLPGGCVLHNTNNLINYNYYPYNGKAYSEDLLHSFLLTQKGIDLYHYPGISCFYDKSSSSVSGVFEFLKLNYYVWRILNYYSLLINSSRFRLFLFLSLKLIYTLFNKIKKFI